MKKFCDLKVNDVIYRCNYNSGNIESYKIHSIKESKFNEQMSLSLVRVPDKKFSYFSNIENSNIEVNVFKNNSYENVRQLIGHSDNIVWCADKKTILYTFELYKRNIINKLWEQETYINKAIG